MLKEKLLKESQDIEVAVELDSIFESVDLSEDAKQTFQQVFETAVKKHALALAETHITEISDKADELVESEVQSKVEKVEAQLAETADKFFTHLAEEWLEENKLAIDRGIKAELFESMLGGLKTLFVEHNVELPEESVDVVNELEVALEEAEAETNKMFSQLTEAKTELKTVKKDISIGNATKNLTESQKEKVQSLVEDIEYSDKFDVKLAAIVEMATAQKEQTAPLTENINTITNDDGLNFVTEEVKSTEQKPQSTMNSYIAAAQKL